MRVVVLVALAACSAGPRRAPPVVAAAEPSVELAFDPSLPTWVDLVHPGFELGAHRSLPCLECHTQALGTALPDPVCHKCHVADSPHGDRFEQFGPPACGACHLSTGWHDIRFNHALQTRFALYPWHDDLECAACHRGDSSTFERLPRKVGCKGCHAHARVHADADHPDGRFSTDQCLLCHPYPGARGL